MNSVTGEKRGGKASAGARVSNTPGRTRQIHFYRVEGIVTLVDLPGYGFAKVSKTERVRWIELIGSYFRSDPGPRLVVSLVDARHEAKSADLELISMAAGLDKELLVVATKSDKLSNNELSRNLKALRIGLNLSADPLAFSAVTGRGLEAALATLRSLS